MATCKGDLHLAVASLFQQQTFGVSGVGFSPGASHQNQHRTHATQSSNAPTRQHAGRHHDAGPATPPGVPSSRHSSGAATSRGPGRARTRTSIRSRRRRRAAVGACSAKERGESRFPTGRRRATTEVRRLPGRLQVFWSRGGSPSAAEVSSGAAACSGTSPGTAAAAAARRGTASPRRTETGERTVAVKNRNRRALFEIEIGNQTRRANRRKPSLRPGYASPPSSLFCLLKTPRRLSICIFAHALLAAALAASSPFSIPISFM